jgi:hypothetical protein
MRRPFCDERAEHQRGALRRRAEHRRWSPSTASGAPARPEGAPDSGEAARVGEGAARQETAGGGARPLHRSWRAPPPLLVERPRPGGRRASPAPARAQLWRASPAPARAQLRRVPSSVPDFEFGTNGEKKQSREGVFANILFNGLGRLGAI